MDISASKKSSILMGMPHSTHSLPSQIENYLFLIKTPVLIGFIKMIGVQNQLHISFGTNLVCDNIKEVRYSLISYYTLNPN